MIHGYGRKWIRSDKTFTYHDDDDNVVRACILTILFSLYCRCPACCNGVEVILMNI